MHSHQHSIQYTAFGCFSMAPKLVLAREFGKKSLFENDGLVFIHSLARYA